MKSGMKRIKPARHLQSGFTLMELMIVMVILSILAAIVMGNYATSTKRGRDNRRKSDLRNIMTALETYYNDKGSYPLGVNGVMTGCSTGDSQPCNWGGQFTDTKGTLYMVEIPQDPIETQQYYFVSDGQAYKIYAKLENAQDTGTGVKQDGYIGTNCSQTSTVLCTYGISSPDTTP